MVQVHRRSRRCRGAGDAGGAGGAVLEVQRCRGAEQVQRCR